MKFSYLSDSFISKFILFSLGIVVGGYLCRNSTCAILFGLIFSLCLSEVYLIAIGKREKKKRPKDYNAVCEKLIFSGDDYVLTLLKRVLSTKHVVKKYGNYLRVDNAILLSRMRPSALSDNEFIESVNFARLRDYKTVIILTHLRPNKCDDLIKKTTDLSVKIIDFDRLYSFLRSNNALPTIVLPTKKQKLALITKTMLDKKRAKSYFVCAFTLFVLSSLVSSSLYYLICACISLALGLAVAFLPREKKE